MMRTSIVGLASACVGGAAYAGEPAGYYAGVDPSSPQSLRATLHEVIDDHFRVPYTGWPIDTWAILDIADEDPSDPDWIIDVYRNAAYPKAGGDNPFYNREHAWPNSYGFPDNTGDESNYPFTDCHHLFLCDDDHNTARSNKPYDNCDANCAEWPTEPNNGRGGGTGAYPGNSNWTRGFGPDDGVWETWRGRRGDVARAIFYMDIRYEGGTHSDTGAVEPDLRVTNNRNLIVSDTQNNRSVGYMGLLSVLVEWHFEDPPDYWEMRRNDVVYAFQGNRNPFIDHPEWAACLYEGECMAARMLRWTGAHVPQPWINEFHYDNSGTDAGEFVEIAGRAGRNLAGWTLWGYNGASSRWYDIVSLSGTIPDLQNGFGVLAFTFAGLQNGSPDGMALVDPAGRVVEFLSYEGAFPVVDGPARGMLSEDVGVAEGSGTPAGFSLQLAGAGHSAPHFRWQAPSAATRGQTNTGQVFE